MKGISGFVVLASLVVSSTAAAQLATRCSLDDQLTTYELSQGRNAWSRKCGYITTTKEGFLNSEGEYQVYSQGCYAYPNVPVGSDCKFFVPVSEAAACIPNLVKLGTCVTGCYTAQEKVAFGGEYWPISEAFRAGVTTVSALTQESTIAAPRFGEQQIRAFVAGDTVEDVFAIETEDGRRVEVTSEHPMVNGEGVMVKAKTLKQGDTLLGVDGKKVDIASVNVFRYEGTTWNVQPVSHEKIENVLDVNGLLTGSVRFQNEWAADHYRLSLRDEADVRDL